MARTRATPKMKPTIPLPPAGDTYQVIGQVRDIKMFVVKYDDTFYRGGEPVTKEAVKLIRDMGVKTIISVCPTEAERMWCRQLGVTLVEVPFDEQAPVPAETLKAFLAALDDSAPKFYIHGFGGTHRGGVLGAAYRMHRQGWTFKKAAEEVDRLGGNLKRDAAMLESVRKQH